MPVRGFIPIIQRERLGTSQVRSPVDSLLTLNLCIINFSFVCITALYLGIGMPYMKFQRGARGKEMIPYYSFWCEIPALAKVCSWMI